MKRKLKLLLTTVFVLITAFQFAACQNNAPIVGEWEPIAIIDNDLTYPVSQYPSVKRYFGWEFDDDGTCVWKREGAYIDFYYTFENNVVTVYEDEDKKEKIVELTYEKEKLIMNEDYLGMGLVFEKE